MRTITLTTIALALVSAVTATATAATPRAHTFNVSLYGIQRYTDTETEVDVKPDDCWGARGTTTSRSIVRFHSTAPVRVKASVSSGQLQIDWPRRADGLSIPIVADWGHSGESDRETRSCVGSQGDGWIADPPVPATNCHATVTDRGFGLEVSRRSIATRGSAAT